MAPIYRREVIPERGEGSLTRGGWSVFGIPYSHQQAIGRIASYLPRKGYKKPLFRKKMQFPPTPNKQEVRKRTVSGSSRSYFRAVPSSSAKKMRLRSGRRYGRRRYRRNYRKRNPGFTKDIDRVLQYRYKRMPRYKKRRYIKKASFVKNVMSKMNGTKTLMFNSSITGSASLYDQVIFTATLYGNKGNPDNYGGRTCAGLGDLWKIFDNDPDITNTTAPNIKLLDGKLVFYNAVLDLTLYNIDAEGAKKKEIDIYEIIHPKHAYENGLVELYNQAAASTGTIGVGTGLTLFTRGATPFEFPHAGVLGAKVLKKYKFYVEPTGTLTYQIRMPYTKILDAQRIQEYAGYTAENIESAAGSFVYPGLTRSLLIIAKNVDGTQISGNTIRMGATRSYRYHKFTSIRTNDALLDGAALYP